MASLMTSSLKGISPKSDLMQFKEDPESPQVQNQYGGAVDGPMTILWDIENCPVPSYVRPEDVAGNIRAALRSHPVTKGVVTVFSAYGDFNAFPRRLREGCQRTGVKLVDVPNGRKDAADKAILVDMFLFALDYRPPSTIVLISGDIDFAPALHILGQRGYIVILVIPSGVGVSSALSNAGRFVWDWPSLARGEGFVSPAIMSGKLPPERAGFVDVRNDMEPIVYRGPPHCEFHRGPSNNFISACSSGFRESSRASYCFPDGSCSSSSMPQAHPGDLYNSSADRDAPTEQDWWVRPGDLQGLKGQLVRLLEKAGGSLPLVRVPSCYLKMYGKHLYMADYGVFKLVHLINKMNDAFILVGKGKNKALCLRPTADRSRKNCPVPILLRRNEDYSLEETVPRGCPQLNSSSDCCSEDDTMASIPLDASDELDDPLASFSLDVQELLVCYCCPVPLRDFEELYKQRYKKVLDYRALGADCLETLLDRVADVACVTHIDEDKFIVSI